jgi:hypothetical protein
MSRHLALLLCTLTLIAGCSRDPERRSATIPTTPSASAPEPGSLLGPTSVAPGGISGKFDLSFPPRNEPFDMRNQLENYYQTVLGRAPGQTTVDKEGEVVWTQEYIRYRVNGCDHNTAVQRVLAQIAGQQPGLVCGTPPDGPIVFPPRQDVLEFRRILEATYAAFNRGFALSSVDLEGGVIWTQEYLRYRLNACDHAVSLQKIFSQIAGGGVAATCFVAPCMFAVSPAVQTVTAAGGTFTTTVSRTSGESCTYGAESLDSYVTIGGGASGTGAANTVTYTVGPNFGGARTALIRVRWANNSTLLTINQEAGLTAGFIMGDPNAGQGSTTTCMIRTGATPCVFTATGSYTANAVYTWHIDYQYGGGISHDFTSTSNTFTFTQACGGPGATAGGTDTPMNVTLTVVDGNTVASVQSGSGSQPSLSIRFFTC